LNKPKFHRCTSAESTFEAISHSTRFPGLFETKFDDYIDGGFFDLDKIVKKKNNKKWLYFDLQNKSSLVSDQDLHIFYPKLSIIPGVNAALTILNNRCTIDNLIYNGRMDAMSFVRSTINQ
jgi:hypothetical protein